MMNDLLAQKKPAYDSCSDTVEHIPAEWGAPIFVWGVWVILVLGALAFSRTYSVNVPFSDEWWYVPHATGTEPMDPEWLWADHSSHRIPIPKLIWASLFRITGFGFQVGAYINVILVGLLAMGLTLVARSLRGRTAYTDAFFSIALLNWGHCVNFTMWWQITEIVAPIISSVILSILVLYGRQLTPRLEAIVSLCLFLLPLAGPSGLPLVLTMSVWFCYLCILRWKERQRMRAILLACVPVACALLVILYFHGMGNKVIGEGRAPFPDKLAIARTVVQFFSVSLGSGTEVFWKYTGAIVLSLIISNAMFLAWVWLRNPFARPQELGLLLFLCATVGLGLGIAVGRAHLGAYAGLNRYYPIFGIPALCCIYLVWVMSYPATFGRLAQMCMFSVVCSLFSLNISDGVYGGSVLNRKRAALESDILAGIPIEILADRHARFLCDGHNHEQRMTQALQQLRKAGFWPFRKIKDLHGKEYRYSGSPVAVRSATWRDGRITSEGKHPSVTFSLDPPRTVIAVRLTFVFRDAQRVANCTFHWSPLPDREFSNERVYAWEQNTTVGRTTRTIWIDDTVAKFEFSPDTENSVCDLEEIVFVERVPRAVEN